MSLLPAPARFCGGCEYPATGAHSWCEDWPDLCQGRAALIGRRETLRRHGILDDPALPDALQMGRKAYDTWPTRGMDKQIAALERLLAALKEAE